LRAHNPEVEGSNPSPATNNSSKHFNNFPNRESKAPSNSAAPMGQSAGQSSCDSLAPIRWESGIGSDVMKPIAASIVGGMITSTIHVLILVPLFFAIMKERAQRERTLN
jgi:hypothetical protein